MSDTLDPAAAEPREQPWTEYVDSLLRWRRFVFWGTALSWAALLTWAAVWPRTNVVEATVALPSITFVEPKRTGDTDDQRKPVERTLQPGVPIGTYKKLEAALGDAQILTKALGAQVGPKTAEGIRRNLRQVVAPVTTGVRDELIRADREDLVTAVRLSFAGTSTHELTEVVTALAHLVREALATRAARDRVEGDLLKATLAGASALTKKVEVSAQSENLKTLIADLTRLAATAPPASAGGHEVVDLKEGGYRYLPASVQLVGAKAWRADNDFEIRQYEWRFSVESLRVAFYRRLARRLRGDGSETDLSVVDDVPSVIDDELRAFTEKQSSPAIDYLRAEVEGLRDLVRAQRTAASFVQRPSFFVVSRASFLLLAMVGSAMGVLFAALVGESWRRYHAQANQG